MSEQLRMLSEEDFAEITRRAMSDDMVHAVTTEHPDDLEAATVACLLCAAYALGVERARKVRPLVWSEIDIGHPQTAQESNGCGASYRVYLDPCEDDLPWTAKWSDGVGDYGDWYKTEEQAKAACQAHHEAFVQLLVDRQAEIIAAKAERIKELEAVNSQKLLDENRRLKSLLSETRGHLQGRKMSMLASTPERLLEKIEAALKGE